MQKNKLAEQPKTEADKKNLYVVKGGQKKEASDAGKLQHESEVQRQYVRVEMPCTVYINRKAYKAENISCGGFKINTESDLGKSEKTVKLLFPLHNSCFHVVTTAEQVYFDKEKGVAGFKFIGNDKKTISLIQNMVQNYLSGLITTDRDILKVASQDNYVSARTPVNLNENQGPSWPRYVFMGTILLGAIAGLMLIAGNVYEQTAFVKSYGGVVEANKFTVRSNINGEFYSLLSQNSATVSEGQPIAVIRPQYSGPESGPGITEAVLKSPCDCTIVNQYANEGEFRALGEPVFDLLDNSGDTWVVASVKPEEAHKLNIYDDAYVKIAGESSFMEGSLVSFMPSENGASRVKVSTEEPISQTMLGLPAYVEFNIN
ncbi:MAG: HlyD family efflux transporter periplasmic adaptor subunit [Alphaproteobacteria bacterium]